MNNNNNRQNNGQQYRQTHQPSAQYPYRPNAPQGRGYPPVRHRSRRQARRAAILTVLSVAVLVMLLVTVVIFFSRCASNSFGNADDSTSDSLYTDDSGNAINPGDTTDAVPTDTTAAPETELAATYEYVEKTEADMHKGYQILVNYQNEYTFEGDFDIQPFYGNKNLSYKVRDTLVAFDSYAMSWCNKMMAAMEADLGNNYVLVNSSFRDYDEQESIYAAYFDKYGEEYAQLFVAMPGHSEHHTGLAVDFTVYTDNGEAFKFDDKPEYPEWLVANGYKYGFIQRYTKEKTDITKIAYENWHYRYIGKPHAYYVVKNDLCYEEYIDLLRGFEFGDKHLQITDDEGTSWEIYFVPADPSGVTKIPVPKYAKYEISGNNVDGFIVTCGG